MSLEVSTDTLMWNCFKFLQADLKDYLRPDISNLDSVRDVRGYKFEFHYSHPYAFKSNVQVLSWLKRYRFEHDVYSDDELESRTNEKFMRDQVRIAAFRPYPLRATLVLQKARLKVKQIVGKLADANWQDYCRFSRNAVVGYTGESTYLDCKIHPDAEFTGTLDEISIFDDTADSRYKSIFTDYPHYTIVSHLTQINVPKNAEIMRPVRPNTLLGSYITYGIGKYLVKRYKEVEGVDLNHRQEKHKVWAQEASVTLRSVTADMSSCSDSFTSRLMNMLLPRDWFNFLNQMRTSYVKIGKEGKPFYSPSFMAMGIGYTFPLMSICLDCIIRSAAELLSIRGRVSVFGDDLIYPRKLHAYIIPILEDLGFVVNEEKTFSHKPFRESCGGDYYDGQDVRPARPEGVFELLTSEVSICAYVYKLYNSLIRRWEEEEIPLTLTYLRSIITTMGHVYFVPRHFPDTSGFKCDNWRNYTSKEIASSNRRKPFYWGQSVACLTLSAQLRPCGNQTVYYVESLQGIDEDPYLDTSKPTVLRRKRDGTFVSCDASTVILWRKHRHRRVTGKLTGRVYRKLEAFTGRKTVFGYTFSKAQAIIS